jgi:hypothetical protein
MNYILHCLICRFTPISSLFGSPSQNYSYARIHEREEGYAPFCYPIPTTIKQDDPSKIPSSLHSGISHYN